MAVLPAGLTYTIVTGDINGNYTVNGNLLQMANDTDVVYIVSVNMNLIIVVTDGYTWCKFTATFSTGDAWYQNDAQYALSTIVDQNTAAMNPSIGSALPKITGTGATVVGDLWDMDGNGYYLSTAATASMPLSNSHLIALVLDKDNQSAGFAIMASFGGGDFWNFYTGTSVSTNFCIRTVFTGGIDNKVNFAATTPSGKHVYWAFWDSTTKILTAGYDQNSGSTNSTDLSAKTLSQNISIGGNAGAAASLMKFGSFQVVNRANMTLADAKAAIAKMQTYHSIP